ncbi:MAG: hypothetical protein Q9217_005784 [Psora testacea]
MATPMLLVLIQPSDTLPCEIREGVLNTLEKCITKVSDDIKQSTGHEISVTYTIIDPSMNQQIDGWQVQDDYSTKQYKQRITGPQSGITEHPGSQGATPRLERNELLSSDNDPCSMHDIEEEEEVMSFLVNGTGAGFDIHDRSASQPQSTEAFFQDAALISDHAPPLPASDTSAPFHPYTYGLVTASHQESHSIPDNERGRSDSPTIPSDTTRTGPKQR